MSRAVFGLVLLTCVGLGTAWAQDPAGKQPDQPGQAAAGARAPGRGAAPVIAVPTEQPARRAPVVTRVQRPINDGTSVHERLVRPVENLSADDVAGTLRRLLAELREAGQLRGEVVIVSEMATNTLLISAAPENLEEIGQLIDQLDRERPSVRVELMIVEVQPRVESPSPSRGQPTMGGAGQAGFSFPPGGAPARRGGGAPRTTGRPEPSDSANAVQQQLRALRNSGQLAVLSRPQITALENQPAYLQVSQAVPTSHVPQAEQVGRPSNVTYEDVGLLVGVTARVNRRGRVTMELSVENSTLVSAGRDGPGGVSASGVVRLPRSGRIALETTVTLADGESAILGGLTGESEPRGSRLLIVVTPHVIAPPE